MENSELEKLVNLAAELGTPKSLPMENPDKHEFLIKYAEHNPTYVYMEHREKLSNDELNSVAKSFAERNPGFAAETVYAVDKELFRKQVWSIYVTKEPLSAFGFALKTGEESLIHEAQLRMIEKSPSVAYRMMSQHIGKELTQYPAELFEPLLNCDLQLAARMAKETKDMRQLRQAARALFGYYPDAAYDLACISGDRRLISQARSKLVAYDPQIAYFAAEEKKDLVLMRHVLKEMQDSDSEMIYFGARTLGDKKLEKKARNAMLKLKGRDALWKARQTKDQSLVAAVYEQEIQRQGLDDQRELVLKMYNIKI